MCGDDVHDRDPVHQGHVSVSSFTPFAVARESFASQLSLLTALTHGRFASSLCLCLCLSCSVLFCLFSFLSFLSVLSVPSSPVLPPSPSPSLISLSPSCETLQPADFKFFICTWSQQSSEALSHETLRLQEGHVRPPSTHPRPGPLGWGPTGHVRTTVLGKTCVCSLLPVDGAADTSQPSSSVVD